jgi:hypothetical protein
MDSILLYLSSCQTVIFIEKVNPPLSLSERSASFVTSNLDCCRKATATSCTGQLSHLAWRDLGEKAFTKNSHFICANFLLVLNFDLGRRLAGLATSELVKNFRLKYGILNLFRRLFTLACDLTSHSSRSLHSLVLFSKFLGLIIDFWRIQRRSRKTPIYVVFFGRRNDSHFVPRRHLVGCMRLASVLIALRILLCDTN